MIIITFRPFSLLSDSGRPGEPGEVGRNPYRHAAELPAGSRGGRLQPEAAGREDHRRPILRQSRQKSPLRNLQAGEIQTLESGPYCSSSQVKFWRKKETLYTASHTISRGILTLK